MGLNIRIFCWFSYTHIQFWLSNIWYKTQRLAKSSKTFIRYQLFNLKLITRTWRITIHMTYIHKTKTFYLLIIYMQHFVNSDIWPLCTSKFTSGWSQGVCIGAQCFPKATYQSKGRVPLSWQYNINIWNTSVTAHTLKT